MIKDDLILCLNIGGTKVDICVINKSKYNLLYSLDSCINLSSKINVESFNRTENEDVIIDLLKGYQFSSIAIASPIKNQQIIYKKKFSKKLIDLIHKLVKEKRTIIQNDSSSCAIPYLFEKKDIVFVTLGTGIGTGVIIDNKLMCGKNGFFGEIGTLPYKNSSLETETTSKRIDYYSKKQNISKNEFVLMLSKYEKTKQINPIIHDFLLEFRDNLANLFDIIMYSYDPEIIFLSGSMSSLFNNLKKEILIKCKNPNIKNNTIQISKMKYPEIIGCYLNYFNLKKE